MQIVSIKTLKALISTMSEDCFMVVASTEKDIVAIKNNKEHDKKTIILLSIGKGGE